MKEVVKLFSYGQLILFDVKEGKTVNPKLRCWIAIDAPDWEEGDLIVLEPVNEDYPPELWKEVFKNHHVITYYDKIPKSGKYKWTELEKFENSKVINDCPDCVSSSLNYYDHPSERKWFLYKNCDYTDNDRVGLSWEEAKEKNFIQMNTSIGLHYILIALFTKIELLVKGNDITDFEEWKDIMNKQFDLNPRYGFKGPYLDEKHVNFLRDICQSP